MQSNCLAIVMATIQEHQVQLFPGKLSDINEAFPLLAVGSVRSDWFSFISRTETCEVYILIKKAWMLFSCAEPADTILVLWVVAQVLTCLCSYKSLLRLLVHCYTVDKVWMVNKMLPSSWLGCQKTPVMIFRLFLIWSFKTKYEQ